MNFSIKIDPANWQQYISVPFKGKQILLNPCLNKGTAFTLAERLDLDLDGLLPPLSCSMETQLERTYLNFLKRDTNLGRYNYLAGLQDRNETLFFRLVLEHIDEMMPIVYTPVVGEACQEFSHIYRRARGLFINYTQKGRIREVLENYPCNRPSVIVVTDGERILGLGDQGTGGMGIPIGKLVLYTLCAGVSPYSVLPITLDVGTDNTALLDDPLYLGLGHKRIRGDDYQDFIDEFVAAVKDVYPDVLLQWEDFLKGNAIKQLKRFRDEICSFNDDIQGTAGVVVAGLMAAMRITNKPWKEQRVVFAGAGASAQGISDLIVAAMIEEGLTREEAVQSIYTVDSRGLVTTARGDLPEFKATFARDPGEVSDWEAENLEQITLAETVCNARPTILIGSSGTPDMFTQEIVRCMAEFNERPIIFPLSNPNSKAECVPADAIAWSDGRAIVATGSPFAPVEHKGKTYRIGQGNNAFIFPGVGLGICACKAKRVSDAMFLAGARALADFVTEEDLAVGAVYPPLTVIRRASHAVACATVRQAVKEGVADPSHLINLEANVRRSMWYPEYLRMRYEPLGFVG